MVYQSALAVYTSMVYNPAMPICQAPKCRVEIHPERLRAIPKTKTCSTECSEERKAEHRRRNAGRQAQRKREAKAGVET